MYLQLMMFLEIVQPYFPIFDKMLIFLSINYIHSIIFHVLLTNLQITLSNFIFSHLIHIISISKIFIQHFLFPLFRVLPLNYQSLLHILLSSQGLNYIIPPFIIILLKVSSNVILFQLFPHPPQLGYLIFLKLQLLLYLVHFLNPLHQLLKLPLLYFYLILFYCSMYLIILLIIIVFLHLLLLGYF